VGDALDVSTGVPPELVALAHDPQTSGGLLAAIPPSQLDAVGAAFDTASVAYWRIGEVEDGAGLRLK
jgi:selenophosphate synthase